MHWALNTHLPSSGIREILDLALARPDAIRLETGEPDFSPPDFIVHAYHQAALQGHNHYTQTAGIPPLKTALKEKLQRINGVYRSPEEILVTPGGIPGLFLAFMGTARTGDEILVPDPGWPDYLGGMTALGIRATRYPLTFPAYLPDLDDLEARVTARTRALVLNFPGNPTGRLPQESLMRDLCQWAADHDLWVISDEVYDQIVFDGHALSPARWIPERTLAVYSFSKTYAMTGWRLGYLTGPERAIASLTQVAMGIWSSVSEPLQYAGLAALQGPQEVVATMRQHYQRRRDLAEHFLDHVGIRHSHPEGAFYLLIGIDTSDLNSRGFALRLLDECGVAVAPGSAFGAMSEGWVRMSLAAPERAVLEGLERLAAFLTR